MRCLKPITVNGREFNCGVCHACRINYTSMWTLRCLYELDSWQTASFITLTYDDKHVPTNYGLQPDELSKFWKRLRINLKNEGLPSKIKYYACGEYGDQTKRPHYHAIVYGLDPYSDQHRDILRDSWSMCEPWFFDKNRKGMLPVCREDIAYVCGYVQKKLTGEKAEREYLDKGIIPPFSRCSRGIGLDFAMKNKDRLIKNGYTYLNGNKVSVPRYFVEKFGLKKSELIKEIPADPIKTEIIENKLLEQFMHEMQLKGMWNPENEKMMSVRFSNWYHDKQFSFAKQIENDFLQKQKMRGKL